MCFSTIIGDNRLDDVIEFAKQFLKKASAPGSDSGYRDRRRLRPGLDHLDHLDQKRSETFLNVQKRAPAGGLFSVLALQPLSASFIY